jgi:hypothetical protein
LKPLPVDVEKLARRVDIVASRLAASGLVEAFQYFDSTGDELSAIPFQVRAERIVSNAFLCAQIIVRHERRLARGLREHLSDPSQAAWLAGLIDSNEGGES